MAPTSIKAFRPFNLQHGEGHNLHVRLQEVIYYGESRFRAAAARIIKADDRHQGWMQACLQQEVVCVIFVIVKLFISIDLFPKFFVMSYAGMATATGQYLHIPIILRSLVTSLSLILTGNLPVPFDAAFIALLEVGTGDEEFGRVVKAYEYTWWDKSREPEDSKLLNANNLDECLNFHDEQLLKSNEPRKTVPRQNIEVTLPFQTPDIGADGGAEAGAEGGAEFQPIIVKVRGHDPEVEECEHCASNHCLIMHALCVTLFDEIKATQQFVSAMADSSRAEVSLASRRCAGFYRLHERAQEKELLSESISVKATGRGTEVQKTSRRVAEIAAADLKRYKAMPSSGRWTWGETLTKDDVLALRHIRKQEVRTGYGTGLPQGTLSREFSATNIAPTGSAKVSSVPQSVKEVPRPTSLLFPSDVGSYELNSTRGADVAPGSECTEPPMELDEVDAGIGAEEGDAASVAARMWLDDAVTQQVEGGAQAGVSVQAQEDVDNEEDAASLAAALWTEMPSAAPWGAEDAPPLSLAEEREHDSDQADAASLAAAAWFEAERTQSGAGGAEPSALTSEDEDKEDDEQDAASLAAKAWSEGEGIQSVARGAAPTAPTSGEDDEGDHEADAASLAAKAWSLAGGIHSAAGGAASSVPTSPEEEAGDDEEDMHDAASLAANAWFEAEGPQSVARGAESSAPTSEEDEEDQDDPASLAANMWSFAHELESGGAGADDFQGEGVDPASLAAELWFSAPIAASHAEEEEEDDDDAASVAAALWSQDEPRRDAQYLAEPHTLGAGTSHASHSNTDANTSVLPQIYTPADFPTEWFEDDADAEHEVDVGMEDLHLVD
jgi:hypothetical protein